MQNPKPSPIILYQGTTSNSRKSKRIVDEESAALLLLTLSMAGASVLSRSSLFPASSSSSLLLVQLSQAHGHHHSVAEAPPSSAQSLSELSAFLFFTASSPARALLTCFFFRRGEETAPLSRLSSLAAMRIRKGARCVPLAATDRSFLPMKVFTHGEENARREDKPMAVLDVNQAAPVVVTAATSSHGPSQDLVLANGASSAGTECLEDDRARRRLSADRRSRKRPPIIADGVISISSIIQAGVKSARRNLTSAPASGEPVVHSVASLARSPMDCSPSIAEKTIDRPNLLLESLKKVCSDAENTGLTAKEAVIKIRDQGLPGLIEGGERLIVQVAKLFRSSPAFAEREERGRYFLQETFQELMGWSDFEVVDPIIKSEKAVPNSAATETGKEEPNSVATETEIQAIEAATQLAKLQSITVEPVCESLGFMERVEKSETGRWVLALRHKDRGERPNSQKTSPSGDSDTGLRCNRDDGKGWRCIRFAESGYSLCKYHREQIRRAELRRKKSRTRSKKRRTPPMPLSPVSSPVLPEIKPSTPTLEEDVKTVTVPEAGKPVNGNSNESDNELPDHKRRRFVKAKSLMLL